MNVYLANFGPKNWAWNECLDRDALTVMDDMRLHSFWQRRDRNGYIETAMREVPTKKGQPPTQSVATRWYNEIPFCMKLRRPLDSPRIRMNSGGQFRLLEQPQGRPKL